MNGQDLIKKQLDKIGCTAYLKDGEWVSMPFKISLSRLWRKKNSAFEKSISELGATGSEYYYYVGPYNHDICAIGEEGVLICDGCQYEFKHREAVKINDKTAYYSGIVRKLEEADYDEA